MWRNLAPVVQRTEDWTGEEAVVLDVFCTGHGRVVLLPTEGIEALRHLADGIEVTWRCPCGTRGATVVGRPPVRLAAVDGSAQRECRVERCQQHREGLAVEDAALG